MFNQSSDFWYGLLLGLVVAPGAFLLLYLTVERIRELRANTLFAPTSTNQISVTLHHDPLIGHFIILPASNPGVRSRMQEVCNDAKRVCQFFKLYRGENLSDIYLCCVGNNNR